MFYRYMFLNFIPYEYKDLVNTIVWIWKHFARCNATKYYTASKPDYEILF